MITSTTNQKVKRIVQLNKRAASRNKEDVFVTEGIKMFLETPEEDLEEVYLSENFFSLLEGAKERERSIREKLGACGYEMVARRVFEKMSDTQSPHGLLCVVRQRH